MRIFKGLLFVTLGLLLLGSLSCTMKQEVYIETTGAGRVSISVGLADYLTDVIDQVQLLVQPDEPIDPNAPFFDTEAISKDFAERDGVTLVSLETPTKNSLVGEFTFDDIQKLFQEIEEGSPEDKMIRFNTSGGVSEVGVVITRETVEAFLAANPSMSNPLVESFGPTTTEGLSDADYLDMMEFALGTESRLGLQESTMDLIITVDGEVISQKGGRQIDKSTVEFSVPVLPFLMLRKPLEYSIRYR